MINNQTINICIPIEVDDYLKEFIFKNINYRRKVWNDFVEEAKKFEGKNFMYDGFKPLKFKTEYFKIEDEEDIYNEMCVGISEQVSKNMLVAVNRVRDENLSNPKGKRHKIQFHGFDQYYGSFKVNNKPSITNSKDKNISNRIHIKDKYTLTFRVRGCDVGKGSRYKKEILTIHLKEPLFKYIGIGDYYPSFIREYKVKGENAVECWFNELDIKETCFIHKLGKFYIQLSITVSYKIKDKDIRSRQLRAGIDTGIHNPCMIYLGKGYFKDIRMPDKISIKIHYLERRARRLQHIMDRKRKINEERVKRGELKSIYTNNYKKIRYKYRKVWAKIVNIKRNWIYNECKKIVTNYQIICVDRFRQPGQDDGRFKSLPSKVKRHINYANRFHCMYTFNEILKHMAIKYGCTYIDSPPSTTCTCSFCGTSYEANTDDLRIRKFACNNKDCTMFGILFDRDRNAARNCYKYIKKYL